MGPEIFRVREFEAKLLETFGILNVHIVLPANLDAVIQFGRSHGFARAGILAPAQSHTDPLMP